MSRIASAVALLLVASTTVRAQAQGKPAAKPTGSAVEGVSWASLKGDWVGKVYRADKSVISEVTTTFTADQKVSITFLNRPAEQGRVIAMGGDSVVVELGPYKSVTREGHMVTTRMTSLVKNHMMSGTFHAKFDDGQTLDGTSEAAHKMK